MRSLVIPGAFTREVDHSKSACDNVIKKHCIAIKILADQGESVKNFCMHIKAEFNTVASTSFSYYGGYLYMAEFDTLEEKEAVLKRSP